MSFDAGFIASVAVELDVPVPDVLLAPELGGVVLDVLPVVPVPLVPPVAVPVELDVDAPLLLDVSLELDELVDGEVDDGEVVEPVVGEVEDELLLDAGGGGVVVVVDDDEDDVPGALALRSLLPHAEAASAALAATARISKRFICVISVGGCEGPLANLI